MEVTLEMLLNRKQKAKHRTIPGYSVSSKELLQRVKNKSIVLDNSVNVYSDNEEIVGAARKSRVENARDMLSDGRKIEDLSRKMKKQDDKLFAAKYRSEGRREAIKPKDDAK